MDRSASFLFTSCQCGAEQALKDELQRFRPELRFAYSRPGFVTFKWLAERPLDERLQLRSVFARTYGVSLDSFQGDHAAQLAARFWESAADVDARHLHVWARDTQLPGDHGFEPGRSALTEEVAEILANSRPPSDGTSSSLQLNRPARPGQRVLDCVLLEPGHWWAGYHRAERFASRWPGGVYLCARPEMMISRAYLKMAESLAWSRLPLKKGDACVEIGSAPGGSCQALLDRGMLVTGIDPAEMDPRLLAHPRFTHVRKRAKDLKRKEYRDVRWLMVDSNVAPKHSLDTVQDIVTHSAVNIRGMIITLKLLDWKLAEEIPNYLQRIKEWGYQFVKVRQLAYNRREICVAALRRKAMLRRRRQ